MLFGVPIAKEWKGRARNSKGARGADALEG